MTSSTSSSRRVAAGLTHEERALVADAVGRLGAFHELPVEHVGHVEHVEQVGHVERIQHIARSEPAEG